MSFAGGLAALVTPPSGVAFAELPCRLNDPELFTASAVPEALLELVSNRVCCPVAEVSEVTPDVIDKTMATLGGTVARRSAADARRGRALAHSCASWWRSRSRSSANRCAS